MNKSIQDYATERDISPERLRHIRWIGGGSGAGKSTVARLLAEEYGLHLYQCDDTQSAHTARSNAADHPMLHTFLAMSSASIHELATRVAQCLGISR